MNRLLHALERPAAVPVVVTVLAALWWAVRIALLDGLGGDEAEQVLFAQSFQWGYDVANPPLYTWLLIAVFAVMGKSAGVVLGLKFAALASIYVALHAAARRSLGPERPLDTALAALSPLLIFYVGWNALFSYSHSLLNALFVVLVFMLALRLAADGRWRVYLALGAAVGLGMLTKYTFALFLAGLIAAGLTLPELRRRLLSPRLLVAAAVAALVFAPHGLWLIGSFDDLRAATAYKLEIDAATPWLAGVGNGLLSLVAAFFAFLSPLWLVVFAVFPGLLRPAPDEAAAPLTAALIGRAFAVMAALAGVLVLAGGATHFRGNYLFFLVLFPLWAFARLPKAPASDRRRAVYAALLLAAAAGSTAVLAAKSFVDPGRCRKCQELVPYAALADGLRDHGFTGGTLFASWYPIPLPGNLALFLDEARVISAKFPGIRPPHRAAPGQCLLVWSPLETGGTDAPSISIWARRAFAAEVPPETPVTRLELSMNGNPERRIPIDFILLDPGTGDCR